MAINVATLTTIGGKTTFSLLLEQRYDARKHYFFCFDTGLSHLSLSPSGTVKPLPISDSNMMQGNIASLAERPLTASSPPPHQDVRLMIPLFGAAVLILVLGVAGALYWRRKAERKRYENYAYSGKQEGLICQINGWKTSS